jgi:signal transduction histidine kinase
VEVAAYRIAVEALTNTARHARARRCDLTIRCDADALRLTVQDDGSGLGGSDEGIGISSMKSRAAEVGGSCLVTTQGDGGAQVVAVLPLGSPP